MESWTVRKRPWAEDYSNDQQLKRRGMATTPSGAQQTSPLPPRIAYYSRDDGILSHRRLPPLYTLPCKTSAECITSRSSQNSPGAQDVAPLNISRPRSQSLFNILQHPHSQGQQQGYTEHPIYYPRTLELDDSSPSVTEVHWPCFGTGPTPHAAGAVICCPSNYPGQECLSTRNLVRTLTTDLALLGARVRTITHTEIHLSDSVPRSSHLSTKEALQWALDLVQWTNDKLQEQLEQRPSPSLESEYQPDASPSMRRGQHHLEEPEEQSPPNRKYPIVPHGFSGFTHPRLMPEDSRRNPYGSETTPTGNSPYHTPSSSGSVIMPPQSPMQALQPLHSTILPSPSSLSFPNVPHLPTISPAVTSVQQSAQSIHLQDLQHQISVKTLAFQTLQREYDDLLQNLERQRSKSITLEKKFEINDIEINNLTEAKGKLQGQVVMMESQVEELQQSRDEARSQLVANGAQYRQIMEMANRLQAQGAEDKKKWQTERTELGQRIQLLEEAMVTGNEQATPTAELSMTASPALQSVTLPHNAVSSSSSQAETVNVLRAEVGRLRSRTHTLETALQTMRRESISIQAAARQLVESGGKLENVAQSAVGGGG
ncbi:uncharacterized protein K460DRAFT_398340 [Cucurbitaria berberidis CBS 394.84]|uniref:Uncharacterized protein n=1 Tax=Cucurbitaria berberidis CBS 394.84 TaxID=1168544 RepID=A0A9P4GAQ7_9PLEO|nr:uncharacterized protein K460DRAFT_398340 [Cucurbitaria berberidis CBS 394.84]KAF1842328.1 hypothetical protein K460DRAFT_398340 [Cucurbitaria berberidis CBS 394.84]